MCILMSCQIRFDICCSRNWQRTQITLLISSSKRLLLSDLSSINRHTSWNRFSNLNVFEAHCRFYFLGVQPSAQFGWSSSRNRGFPPGLGWSTWASVWTSGSFGSTGLILDALKIASRALSLSEAFKGFTSTTLPPTRQNSWKSSTVMFLWGSLSPWALITRV